MGFFQPCPQHTFANHGGSNRKERVEGMGRPNGGLFFFCLKLANSQAKKVTFCCRWFSFTLHLQLHFISFHFIISFHGLFHFTHHIHSFHQPVSLASIGSWVILKVSFLALIISMSQRFVRSHGLSSLDGSRSDRFFFGFSNAWVEKKFDGKEKEASGGKPNPLPSKRLREGAMHTRPPHPHACNLRVV